MQGIQKEKIKAIILMAGGGNRLGGDIPKQFQILGNKPIYQWALEKLEQADLFNEIILVCHPNWVGKVETSHRVVKGGATRQKSSYLGLLAAGKEAEIVLIHDGARPFLSQKILEENIAYVRKYGAVNTCIPLTDTLVYAPEKRLISDIPKRSDYLRGQTPQTFSYPLILNAHETTKQNNASDDCQLIVEQGKPVHIVEGDETNIKITTPIDLEFARFFLEKMHDSPQTHHL